MKLRAGTALVVLVTVIAVSADVLAPHDPYLRHPELLQELSASSIPGPRAGFPLGSDELGHDLLSRLVVGTRQSLLIGVCATLLGLAIGGTLGVLAATIRTLDTLLMRLVDVLLSVPGLLIAISAAALVDQPDQWTVVAAVGVTWIPVFARLLRGSMLAAREAEHVLAARALGVRERTVVVGHVLPHSLSATIVQATFAVPLSIVDAAALSFLGLGDPDRPEWGAMLGTAGRYVDTRPELMLYPATAIIVMAVGFTILGDGLRERLSPPRST